MINRNSRINRQFCQLAQNIMNNRLMLLVKRLRPWSNRKVSTKCQQMQEKCKEHEKCHETVEALESLAAFLTVVSPAFDSPDWPYITSLNAIFKQVEKLTKKSSVPNRVRCLLKDVVEPRKDCPIWATNQFRIGHLMTMYGHVIVTFLINWHPYM